MELVESMPSRISIQQSLMNWTTAQYLHNIYRNNYVQKIYQQCHMQPQLVGQLESNIVLSKTNIIIKLKLKVLKQKGFWRGTRKQAAFSCKEVGEGDGFLLAQSTVYTTCDGKKKREVHHHVETEGYDPGTSACFFHFFISLFSAFQMLLCVCVCV